MAADLGYVYDLRTNHVFLEHKCNFRLDLMYYKSLLITLDTTEIALLEIWLGQERVGYMEELGQYRRHDVAVTFLVKWDNPGGTRNF